MSNGIHLGVLLLASGAAWMSASAAELAPKRNLHASYPQVTNISKGFSWIKGQALPTFATPAPVLDCLEVQALSSDEQITFSALQGRINRTQPRIYLLDARSDEGRETWAATPGLGFQSRKLYTRENKFEMVRKYAAEIEGAVLY